jgi:hypothetical protein
LPPFEIPAVEHEIGKSRCLELGAGAVPADQQVCGAPNVEIGNRVSRWHIETTMTLELSDDESQALAQLLRRTIADDPYPLSPRLAPLKAILARLEPPEPQPEPPPPVKAYVAPHAAGRRRRRG